MVSDRLAPGPIVQGSVMAPSLTPTFAANLSLVVVGAAAAGTRCDYTLRPNTFWILAKYWV